MSEMCLNTLNSVLRADMTGEPSLEIVRTLNQMIKERRFQIHPNVLTCLPNLRLKSELNVRASDSRADDSGRAGLPRQNKETGVRTKGKAANQPHLSKKARKVLKERKEVEKEFREAEAVVNKEERAARVGAILLTSPSFTADIAVRSKPRR
jgi:nucleolar complex protein 3